MAEATRSREISENLKKHEILLMEERSNNNRGKSILGEGPSMAAERGSNINTGGHGMHSGSHFYHSRRVESGTSISLLRGQSRNVVSRVYGRQRTTKLVTVHSGYLRKDLPEEYFFASFVSGLRDDIRGAVMSTKPNDFHQAVTLAKKQEGTVDVIIKRANLTSNNFSQTKPTYRNPPSHNSNIRNPQIPPKPPYQNQQEPTQSHKKLLTASEMRARREKNLCYNCDETFVPGHRCKQRQIYMIISEEEELIHNSQHESEIINEIEEELIDDDMTVSLNSLLGTTDMNTLRIKGSVKGQDIPILIDSGSTHCFLDENTAHKLGCKLDYSTPMIVSVADGSKMVSSQIHPVFHAFLLKKKIGHRHSASTQLPAIDNEGQIQGLPRHYYSVKQGETKISSSKFESKGCCSSHSVTATAAQEPTKEGHMA
ncbi:hypothetical protein BUALT_Bualt08G0071700 [Buddleja alternifolia]|uniref:Uncharacterized protein n=1 Tax=Buddleja alternifolia TaxID=168488 RepID=A0AAV6X4D9_9LAMI|nr:hypothetical protein BUALT_Bualt08G0071700 [Buddleja alternifolia]